LRLGTGSVIAVGAIVKKEIVPMSITVAIFAEAIKKNLTKYIIAEFS